MQYKQQLYTNPKKNKKTFFLLDEDKLGHKLFRIDSLNKLTKTTYSPLKSLKISSKKI